MSTYDFDAVVIGGGSAGLTAAGIAANFGAKTMLIERDRLGGDCTWTGCVPSKTLLKAGKVAQNIRQAGDFGLIDSDPNINFKKVIEHVHEVRRDVYEDADRPEIFEDMGIEVVFGSAQFKDEHMVSIKSGYGAIRTVSSRYFFICTGSSAAVPGINGIKNVPYLTNESLFEVQNLPRELLIIGGGPIGIEMAQAMNRLGSQVTLIEMSDRILTNDDPELSDMLQKELQSEGVNFVLNAQINEVTSNNRNVAVQLHTVEDSQTVSGSNMLVATGRKANINGLNLDAAGVEYSKEGVTVNDKCRTNQSHIFACGDATGQYQFTHMSEHMAKVAVTNALLKYPKKIDTRNVPWVTYTDPELAHVGATEEQLKTEGINYEIYRFPYSKIDRALTESQGEGLIKIYAKKWNGKILGADILGAHAGELICEYALAMKNKVSLRNIADTIHPYPTYGLGARRAADQWYIKNQTEWQIKLLKKIFGYRGNVPDFSDPDRIV